ncbi:hypothetical protein [Chryseobacterium sp.]|uniref:hypothetical protein n=1 Tax=Chryseobacterium sp. TaxID=1871047 RepID=UPI0035C72818
MLDTPKRAAKAMQYSAANRCTHPDRRTQLRHKRTYRNQKKGKNRHQCQNGAFRRTFQLFYRAFPESDVD